MSLLRKNITCGLSIALLACVAVPAQQQGDLPGELQSMIAANPVIGRSHIGYKVVDLQTGQVLAAERSTEFYTPASNLKLYTTALALARLGPDYRFKTELRTDAPIASNQTSLHDLSLVGGGDPNLSALALPYQKDAPEGDPLAAFHELADKLRATGITAITGDVIGDATRYASQLYPDGWAFDDTLYGYGAPVSALTFADNTVTLLLHPTEAGELADIQVRPAVPYLVILNNVLTAPAGKTELHVARPGNQNELVIWGSIGADQAELPADVAVDDPAKWAAQAMITALTDEGIRVDGAARSRYCEAESIPVETQPCKDLPPVTIATHTSAPLSQIIVPLLKNSMNLQAEMLLREVAWHEAAPEQPPMDQLDTNFLQAIGISQTGSGLAVSDGSGLSEQDLLTPDSTMQLLQYMWRSPNHDLWLAALPVGGVDGTLQHRFKDLPNADHVHAKTGTLSHVHTLSGYVQTNSGRWLAFSAMVNGAVSEMPAATAFLDQFCEVLLRQ